MADRRASGLTVHRKEDNQPRHVKHECTRGFKRKSFEMDEENLLHLWIEKFTQWKAHKKKRKNVLTETRQDGRAV